jgi:hypothetical protein
MPDLPANPSRSSTGEIIVRQPSNMITNLKRRALEQQREILEEYSKVANDQFGRALDETERVRLSRTIKDIERRLQKIDDEILRLG